MPALAGNRAPLAGAFERATECHARRLPRRGPFSCLPPSRCHRLATAPGKNSSILARHSAARCGNRPTMPKQ